MKPEILLYLESTFALLCSAGYTWAIHRFCATHFTCIRQRRNLSIVLLAVAPSVVTGCHLINILHSPTVKISSLSLQEWIHLCYSSSSPLFQLLPLLWQCLLIFWILQLYRGKKAQKILAAAILLAAVTLLTHFTEALLNCLILFILHLTHIKDTLLLSYGLGYLICCFSTACTIGCICFLNRRMNGFFADRLPRWYVMLAVPLFSIVLLWDCIDLCAGHGILLRGGDHLNPYYNELFSYTGMCVLSALCMCGAGFYMFGMDRIDIEQKQKNQYRSQVVFYRMLEEQYRNLEHLRHDMKNHLIGLQRLIDNQEWDSMTDYIHKMADFGGIDCTDDMTGKSIIDALLYYKKSNFRSSFPDKQSNLADKESNFAESASQISDQSGSGSICWECDVHIPSDCPVDDFDLCVIFGNLLDNALEACRKITADSDRFIKVHAHMVKQCLLIEVANSMTQPGNRKDGIGLRNVKATAEKYNGTVQITAQDNIFRVSVLLAPAPCSK